VVVGSLTKAWRHSSSMFYSAIMKFLSLVSFKRLLISRASASIRSSCFLKRVLQLATILDARLASSKVGGIMLLAETGSYATIEFGAMATA
jgi:hypothetical protein